MLKQRPQIISLVFIILILTGQLSAHDVGFMYIAAGSVETTGLPNTSWHTVGSGLDDDFVQGSSSNWTYAAGSNQLITTSGGSYHIAFSLSFVGDVTTWKAGIAVGTSDPTKSFTRYIAAKDAGTISGSLDVGLEAGNTISLVVQPTDNNMKFTPLYAQVVAVEALEVGSTPIGSMNIYNGSTEITGLKSSNTNYTQITGFGAGVELNGITFDETEQELDVASTGKYFVNYHASFIVTLPPKVAPVSKFELSI